MDDAETLRLLALQSLRRKADELEEGEVRFGASLAAVASSCPLHDSHAANNSCVDSRASRAP